MAASPAPTINLLTSRRMVYDQTVEASAKAKIYAGIVLVVYIGATMMLFGIGSMIDNQIADLDSDINKTKLAIASQAASEQKLTVVTAKAKSIDSIMNRRRELTIIRNSLRSALPEGVKLTRFSIEGSVLSAALSVPHVVKTNQVLDMLENGGQGFAVKKSEVTVGRASDATYSIAVEMSLTGSGAEDGK